MHIGFIVSNFPCEKEKNVGGIETSVKNLSKELVENNHQVSIFVYNQKMDEDIVANNINIYKITDVKFKGLSWLLTRKKIQQKIQAVNKGSKIDIIEAADWSGITAFMKLKPKSVIRLHGSDAYFCSLENRKQKIKNFIFEKLALKNADYIISVSKFTALKTKELFNLKKQIKVIYNGIDVNAFKNTEEQITTFQILYFGTILRKKGVLELAEIFNKVVEIQPNVKLILLGRDVIDVFKKKSTLSIFKELLNPIALLNLEYLESVPYFKVKKYIMQSTVVVLPSLAEAFPMSWLEAMSMKKPMVTSNIGWSKEVMIDGETGYTVDPKNHEEYALKILELLNDSKKANLFGENARTRILNNFSIKITGNENIKFYKSIL